MTTKRVSADAIPTDRAGRSSIGNAHLMKSNKGCVLPKSLSRPTATAYADTHSMVRGCTRINSLLHQGFSDEPS
jgi:hypothetical protein